MDCTGLYWTALGCAGLYSAALGCTGMYWAALSLAGGLGGPGGPGDQSRKNPVSASAMLTGKFLQIRKVFATSSLLVEEFPDTLQYKISR